MHRWTYLGLEKQDMRFELLSTTLNEMGCQNEYLPSDIPAEDLVNTIHDFGIKWHSMRVGSPYGESILKTFVRQPALMNQIMACDVLINRRNVWWPDNLLVRGLQRLLARDLKDINLSAGVLIVGSGASARATVVACAQVGFSKIGISDQYDERGNLMVKEMKRHFFHTDIKFIPENSLTSLPGIYSLAVNTTPLIETNTIAKQLEYFNFLRSQGAIIEFVANTRDTPLVREAKDLGVRVITGCRVATFVDEIWAETLFEQQFIKQKLTFPRDNYCERFEQALNAFNAQQPTALSEESNDQTPT